MGFRLAIGPCGCRPPYRGRIRRIACQFITARLELWKSRLPDQLSALPDEYYEQEHLEGFWVTLATHKQALPSGDTLVVAQALVHTWWWPTFVSLGAVGRMYAEGLLVSADGHVEAAPDDLLWSYR
jgi:hypothetical protein